MIRCETSSLGAIPCLVPSATENAARQRQTCVIFKKMGEESTKAVELAFEGHSLFSCQEYNFKPKLTKGQRQISISLIDPILPAAVSISFQNEVRFTSI